MFISESWLKTWVRTAPDAAEMAETLTLAGLEVGGIERYKPVSPSVVVGEIVAVEPHPNSDKLRVCEVDIGRARTLSIVCGAPNARVGLKSAVALIGAELPGKVKIAKTRIRDIVSSGMLCSSAELGLDDDSAGIMELDSKARRGMPLNEHLSLDDAVLDIDLTPNRGDCLSVSGVAREVAVLFGAQVTGPALKPFRSRSRTRFPVSVKAPADCPRYAGRVIEGIDVGAKTPDWIRERLRKCGLRPISLAVDVTNYVMIELGQPMHAFDLDRLSRGIIVRLSRVGEEIDLLDGSHVEIPPGTLLIADYRGPVALAGIMGGAATAIADGTTNIFLESACFRPGAVAGRARAMGMQTDASHRFERGVDPELQVAAIHRATELLVAAAGGTAGPIIDEASTRDLPRRSEITLRRDRLRNMLGFAIPDREVLRILTRLGMGVRVLRKGWRVRAPSRRYDIEGEHDLIEEIARIYGYHNIPELAPRVEPTRGSRDEATLPSHRFKTLLVDRDYREAITYSFVDPDLQKKIDPSHPAIPLRNPIASNMSAMRTSLWPGLLSALVFNYRRQQRRIRLFESGHVFLSAQGERVESERIGGVAAGPLMKDAWQNGREIDFFDVKGDVEALLNASGCGDSFSFVAGKHPALHPGQCARITRGGKTAGWLGALHPGLGKYLDLERTVYVFELEMSALTSSRVPSFAKVSRFPAMTRDLSILVDDSVTADRLKDAVKQAGGKLLMDVELFDVYTGEGVPEGHRSLSLTLTLQDYSRNLTDAEIEEVVRRVLSAVEKKLGGKLRT
ncbi:MAG: phenylalanine--tRNA ligase subunit beta [Proteobacteria bacterium]|nr:MAG: phenylalanine--tRNA ligase subunit beta [Pseudomonadota bacterium]